MKRKAKVVDLRYAKSEGYRKILGEIKGVGVCPFCPKTFNWHTNPILKKTGKWLITKSFQPYKNTAHHFLIIGERHKEQLSQLTAQDWNEISRLQKWAVKEFNLKGGGIAMRFGDTAHTGATVSHLHMHLIVPRMENGRAIPVWFPFG